MRNASGDRFNVRSGQACHDLTRCKPRCHVDVADGCAKQSIAHDAADQPRCVAAPKRGHQGIETRQPYHLSRADKLASIAAVAPQIRRSPHMISK